MIFLEVSNGFYRNSPSQFQIYLNLKSESRFKCHIGYLYSIKHNTHIHTYWLRFIYLASNVYLLQLICFYFTLYILSHISTQFLSCPLSFDNRIKSSSIVQNVFKLEVKLVGRRTKKEPTTHHKFVILYVAGPPTNCTRFQFCTFADH